MAKQLPKANGSSILTSPLQLFFKVVDKKEANQIFKDKHYAHRGVPISWCFGVYYKEELLGAISFENPPLTRYAME